MSAMQPTQNTQDSSDQYSEGTVKVDRRAIWQERVSNILLFFAAFIVAILINTFIFQSYEVDGSSMSPTLHNGDRLIIMKAARTWASIERKTFMPERGQIIVFHKPNGTSDQLIKRVIGLPGDRVVVKDGKITIYNTEHPDGFNPDSAAYGSDLAETYGNVDVTVGDGEVFVCGDNRIPGASLDSRSILGNVPTKLIVGTLSLRYLPLGDAQAF